MKRFLALSLILTTAACVRVPSNNGDDDVGGSSDVRPDVVDQTDMSTANDTETSPDTTEQRADVVLLLTEEQTELGPELRTRLRSRGHDARLVAWSDFQVEDVETADAIVVPPGGGPQFLNMAAALRDLAVPLVWMEANWAPELGMGTTETFTRVQDVRDIVLEDHQLVRLSGVDDGSADYQLYTSTQEMPCFTTLPETAILVANIAGDNDCASFIHVYEENGGMLTSNTPVPARRVLLPLESPMSTWTAVGDGLFDASVQWAIGATSR